MYDRTFWTVIVCIGAEAIIILLFTHTHTHMHPKHEFPLNFSFQKSRVMKQFPLLSLRPQMHLFSSNQRQETFRRLRTSRRAAATLSRERARLGICTYQILLFPILLTLSGQGAAGPGGLGSWHLKMLIPRH